MILKSLIKFIDRVTGHQPQMSWSERRSLRFSVFVYLQNFIFDVFLLAAHVYLLGFKHAWLFLTAMLINGGSFFAVKIPKLRYIVNFSYIVTISLLIFFGGQIIGNQYQIHLYLIVAAALPFAMFPKRAQTFMIFASLVPMFFLFCAHQNLLQFFTSNDLMISDFHNYATVSSLSTAFLIWSALLYFYQIQIYQENIIYEQNGALIQSEKMRSLGIVAAGISHEINNPLTIINLHLGRLKSQHSNEQSNENEILIQSIHKMSSAITRITAIINGLKTYALDLKEEKLKSFSSLDLINDSLFSFNQKLIEKNVDVRQSKIHDQIIFGQHNQLMQALNILIDNSIDAVGKLSERWIEISTEFEQNLVRIRIADSGKGLSEEVVSNLFVPFFTTNETDKRIGLGLAICHGIIKNMQGTLEYQLHEGHTSFVISIPQK